MSTPIEGLGTLAFSSSAAAGGSGVNTRLSSAGTSTQTTTGGDTATISREGLRAWVRSQYEENSAKTAAAAKTQISWESLFNLSSGTTVLKNGNKQVTSIENGELSVMEYDGDRLVRKETGVIKGGTLTKDIEYYDENGRIAQSVHSQLTGLDMNGGTTNAVLTRSANWYSNGELVREYSDSLSLDMESLSADDLNPDVDSAQDMAGLASALTRENAATQFTAQLRQYSGGKLVTDAFVRQDTSMELETNRGPSAVDGLAAWTTQALSGENSFSASITNYDHNGKVLRAASFTEEIGEDGEKTQRASTTWYNNGELVKKTEGVFEGKVPDGHGLNAELFLENLGIKQEDYATASPQTAGELLAATYGESAQSPEFFLEDLEGNNGQGVFGSLRNLKSFQNQSDPYSLSWTDETYKDGKLASRQVDTQGAEENPDARFLHFAVGAGLTEDESPRLLRQASHTDEAYDEHGEMTASATIDRSEEVVEDERGVYHLWTRSEGTSEGNAGDAHVIVREERALAALDTEADKASQSFDAAADLTLGDLRALFKTLDDPGEGTQEARGMGLA